MNTMRTSGIAAALALLAPFGSTALAQEDQGSGYESELKPGLHVNANSSSSSLLSQAARDRSSVVIGDDSGEAAPASVEAPAQVDTHEVKTGDTLWDICSARFGDPYVWPRIWSYNPKVTNPHWIYPGDVLWLTPPNANATAVAPAAVTPSSVPGSTPQIRRGAAGLLVSNRGYVDKEVMKRAGAIVGAQKETMLLSQFDEAYVEFKENPDVKPGDEFAVFQALQKIKSVEDRGSEMGYLVEILGKVRVTSFDKEKRIARVVIPEAFQPLERGALVGPVHQELQLVAPTPNEREIKGHIVAIFDPTVLAATHQVVFVDRGSEQGVRAGNRFFVIEKRDTYRKSLDQKDDRDSYPFEVIAELRVIEARPNTATCLVTAATRELEIGVEVEMVKGY
jgi:hypothetical protein